jgi:hypothetical protein
MSQHSLDGDLSRWPENPYELLGVSFGVGPRDLRRAYTRLIRTYKPEQYPEHFRRIRDAYETVLQHIEMFGFGTSGSSADESKEGPGLEIGSGPDGQSPGPSFDPLRLESLAQELHRLWERACAGDEAAVYHRLVDLSQRHPGHPEVCIRLYWLLALSPELDTSRSPCDWLAAGLRATGLTGPLRELYRREIEANPAEALTPRYASLLDEPCGPGELTDLVEWRWQAAGRLQDGDVIGRDLQFLRERMLRHGEEAWVRLLLAAMDQLAWTRVKAGRELMKRCDQEIERFEHLFTRLGSELDRLDMLREVAAGWQELKPGSGAPPDLVKLIPLSWTRPFAEARPCLLALLDWLVQHPHEALHTFDQLKVDAPGVLAQFGRVLDQFRASLSSSPEPVAEETATRVTLDLLEGADYRNYGAFRLRLLEFCLREVIAPEQMAEVIAERPAFQLSTDTHLAELFLGDWPLRYVCLGYQLFWA